MKKVILINDMKMKSDSFEAWFDDTVAYGETEVEAYKNILKETGLEECEFERGYDVEDLKEKIKENNSCDDSYVHYLSIDFIKN